ncbi:MAG: hypothetical protein IPM29_09030 [Planctomycetes bacterium]|nr:hypothetical protein [Planctomycetota bacterium]
MDEITRRLTAFLADRTNYERSRPDRPRFSLDTMRALLQRLGTARPAPRVVQITGSKGKGTTAGYLELLGRSAGLRVGVYGSPHVRSVRERVRVDGADVTAAVLESAVHRVTALVDREPLEPAATFFEILTAAAVLIFAEARVDLAVMEVGLGGRLDATTAVVADASIMTGVELEHTAILGDTVEEIAAEKAFVLRPGGIGFLALREPALGVARAFAERVGCRTEVLGADFGCEPPDPATGDCEVWRGVRRARLRVGGMLAHERQALALAFACLDALAPDREPRGALARPRLPGRFEVRRTADGEPLFLDGAHTPDSCAIVARELLAHTGGRPAATLLAIARGKRWQDALSRLRPAVDSLLVTRLSDTLSVDPDELCREAARLGIPARAVADVGAGYAALCALPGPRLVTGSFYLVGEIEALLPAGPEP